MNNSVDSRLAYEIATSSLLEKERKILELTIMYNQVLQELERVRRELEIYKVQKNNLNNENPNCIQTIDDEQGV